VVKLSRRSMILLAVALVVVIGAIDVLVRNLPTEPPPPSGARSLSALRRALLHSNAVRTPSAEEDLVRELVLHGRGAVGLLREGVRNDDPDVRYVALSALFEIGPDAAGAIPELIAALAYDDIDSYTTAKGALINIGPPAIEPLRQAVASGSGRPQLTAAEALARLGDVDDAIGPLLAALQDPSPRARYEAANALRRIGPPADAAVEPLQKLAAGDPQESVRSAAAEALQKILPPPATAPASQSRSARPPDAQ